MVNVGMKAGGHKRLYNWTRDTQRTRTCQYKIGNTAVTGSGLGLLGEQTSLPANLQVPNTAHGFVISSIAT